MKGLIIQQPWIELILSGEKSWEMRPRSWSHRGPLALIEKGSGKVVGVATVNDCRPALSHAEMRQYFTKHRIPERIYTRDDFKWFTPLVLTDVRRLQPAVPYKHKNGAQNPVNLDADAEREVLRQLGQARPASRHLTSTPTNAPIPIVTRADKRAEREPDQLVVELIIKDSSAVPRRAKMRGWVELIGMWGVAAALFCQFGFIIHLVLGMSSSSISALAAFKWLVPMFIAMVLAGLCGQEEMLASMASQPKPRRRRRRR